MKLKLYLSFCWIILSMNGWQVHAQNDLSFQSLFKTEKGKEVACYRIPALTTAPNGDVIAAIDERALSCGDLKWNRDINIVIRRSTDHGKTWLPIERIIDYPLGESASDPSFIVDRETQTIFLFFNYMDLDKEKNVYYFKYIKSFDHGKTWSKPIDITNEIALASNRKDFQFITSGRGTQAKTGTLLHTLVNVDKGVYIFGSNNHGQTWFVQEKPLNPADESKIIELENGTWMVNSRVNKAGFRYIHTSKNKGKTWETSLDSTLVDPGCNGSLLVYPMKNEKSDLLLFSNLDSEKERALLTVKVSSDNGKTWAVKKVIYQGSAAYSSLTILPNGDIGLFFEKDNYTDNVFTSFKINSFQY